MIRTLFTILFISLKFNHPEGCRSSTDNSYAFADINANQIHLFLLVGRRASMEYFARKGKHGYHTHKERRADIMLDVQNIITNTLVRMTYYVSCRTRLITVGMMLVQ